MSDEFYEKLRQRLTVPDGQILTYDEVMRWPEGKLDQLMREGNVRVGALSETVECIECPERCPIEPYIREHPETGKLIGVYVCPEDEDIGRFTVDLERRRRWEIVNMTPKKKKRLKKKKAAVKKTRAETSFTPWESEKKACFAYQSGTVHFCYKNECKKISFKADSQAPLVLALFLEGTQTGKRIKELTKSNLEPSQIVRNLNRTINANLRKAGFTDIQGIQFISFDDSTHAYHLKPDIVEYAIYLAHYKNNL